MNKELIDQLIESREKITNVRDEVIKFDLVDAIDTLLHQVPAGQRNDVDLLLGRQCAVLPVRPDYGLKPGWSVNPVVTMELNQKQIAEMEARCAETMTEAPDYPGMWK